MIPNDNLTVLTNKLEKLMENHEKIIEIVKKNKKLKLKLGLIRIVDPKEQEQQEQQEQQDTPSQQEQLPQIQQITKKQKSEQKFRQTKKNIKQEIFQDLAVKIIQNINQDFQNQLKESINNDSNVSQDLKNNYHKKIQKQDLDDDYIPEKITHNRAQNLQHKNQVCRICNRVFKNINKLTYHQEIAHQISFSQQEPPFLRKYVKK